MNIFKTISTNPQLKSATDAAVVAVGGANGLDLIGAIHLHVMPWLQFVTSIMALALGGWSLYDRFKNSKKGKL